MDRAPPPFGPRAAPAGPVTRDTAGDHPAVDADAGTADGGTGPPPCRVGTGNQPATCAF